MTLDGDSGKALGCQVFKPLQQAGKFEVKTAAGAKGAGAARDLLAGLEETFWDGLVLQVFPESAAQGFFQRTC